ncbi:MAG: DUF4280 domain-containing protein [Rubrivivax sp.]|nr:DUF4280 domain-containing protein [Rubrivivax sp.]
MPQQVVNSAPLRCSMGAAPSALVVLPLNRVMSGNQPAANIMDHKPLVNIMPFGVCRSLAYPATAAATAAAMGALTPMPCMPATPAPWVPGSVTVMVGNQPALNNSCKLMCAFGGVIQVVAPGQMTEMIP